jgi:hypothetical protein
MAYTGDFAIVAEGVTDHHILTAVLEGFYEKYDRELELRYEQPPIDATAEGGGYAPGGWTLVLDYFRQRKYLQALQFNRYLVVQIDTDVAEEYGVSAQVGSERLSPEQLVQAVIAKLCELLPTEVYNEVRPRLLFAIGVDEIECWLLPLVFDKGEKKKRAKMTGCLEAIDHKRRLQSETTLDRGGGRGKNPDSYRTLAKALTKRKVLNEACRCNAGFQHFVEQLEELYFRPEELGIAVPPWARPGMAFFLGHETCSPHARRLESNKITWARSMTLPRVVSTTALEVDRPSPRRFGHRAGGRTTRAWSL